MDKRTRFHRTIERREVDRPACWLGLPVPAAEPALYRHFGVSDAAGLRAALDDDVTPVEMPYHDGGCNAIYAAFDFAVDPQRRGSASERTLSARGWFADHDGADAVARFPWPDPARCIDPAACRAAVAAAEPDRATVAMLWSAHFQDACAAFGMEEALMVMKAEPERFQAVIGRITAFYLEANRIMLEATRGRLDAVLIGNDFGSQTGLIARRADLERFVLPGTRALVAQAKSYGVKVLHHSCGAVCDLIDPLIACGVDAIHPIQALARGMEAEGLRRRFGGKVSFCGGVDAQRLLVHGGEEEVAADVRRLAALFPTGLVISPSHEAVLPDVAPANLAALVRGVRSAA
ncbi:MAG: methyltransferase [Planctomycetes bacterium]|nr:methyltransferase [Planctomycetota bacterium]